MSPLSWHRNWTRACQTDSPSAPCPHRERERQRSGIIPVEGNSSCLTWHDMNSWLWKPHSLHQCHFWRLNRLCHQGSLESCNEHQTQSQGTSRGPRTSHSLLLPSPRLYNREDGLGWSQKSFPYPEFCVHLPCIRISSCAPKVTIN